jgi:hypothetical protein
MDPYHGKKLNSIEKTSMSGPDYGLEWQGEDLMIGPRPLGTEINNQQCEAVGCEEPATKQITVNAGKFGTLILLVCKNCTSKFIDG